MVNLHREGSAPAACLFKQKRVYKFRIFFLAFSFFTTKRNTCQNCNKRATKYASRIGCLNWEAGKALSLWSVGAGKGPMSMSGSYILVSIANKNPTCPECLPLQGPLRLFLCLPAPAEATERLPRAAGEVNNAVARTLARGQA